MEMNYDTGYQRRRHGMTLHRRNYSLEDRTLNNTRRNRGLPTQPDVVLSINKVVFHKSGAGQIDRFVGSRSPECIPFWLIDQPGTEPGAFREEKQVRFASANLIQIREISDDESSE